MNNLIQASGQPCEVGALVPFFRQKAERYSASAKVAVLASGRNALQIHPHLTTLLTFLGRVRVRHCSCTHILPEYTHSHTHVSGTQSLIFFFPQMDPEGMHDQLQTTAPNYKAEDQFVTEEATI